MRAAEVVKAWPQSTQPQVWVLEDERPSVAFSLPLWLWDWEVRVGGAGVDGVEGEGEAREEGEARLLRVGAEADSGERGDCRENMSPGPVWEGR